MFICTVRATTLKLFAAVLAGVVLLCTLGTVALHDRGEAAEVIRYSGMKTEEDRQTFLRELGWEPSGAAVAAETFTVPRELDRLLCGYNELQKQQGLDLSAAAGKHVTRYTYVLTNFPEGEGTVYANLIVYKNRVIAGDICSAEKGGFVRTLEGK